jgi:thioredoxin-dependent peroxiredoxin
MNPTAASIDRSMRRTLPDRAPLLILALSAALVGQAAEMPAAGTKAPNFTLPSQTGRKISLKQFRGQWVVLYFYPKDMTPGCTIEAHNFQRDLDQYKAKHAVILGVSADNVGSHKEFCAKESLTFHLLADPGKKVIELYGTLAPNGMMASRNTFLIGPKGTIRKVYTHVNPTPHSQQVLADLSEMEHAGE